MMKRIYVAAVAVCLTGVIVVGVVYFLQPTPVDLSHLSWGVAVGHTYQYDILASSYSSLGGISSEQVLPLNGTSIIATVNNLPSLDVVYDAASFASEIIYVSKVSCSFINGTEPDEWANATLSDMVSGCILPIGDWSALDTLFPDDSPGFIPSGEFIATTFDDGIFTIEYGWWGPVDDGGGWSGSVSLSTGVPASIVWTYRHGVDTLLIIQLTIVGSVAAD
jgi:hypothetical protein